MQQPLKLDLRKLRLEKDLLLNMLKIGLPTGIQSSMYSLSNIIVQAAINAAGGSAYVVTSVEDVRQVFERQED